MTRALQLAERGRCTTHPNPRVGCVIVVHGKIVGEGFHQRAGGPHAEIVALRAAGKNARGADVYVTLEPCCHHGRTGPCTDVLIEAGVRRVVVATRDPNPKVAGRGLGALRRAGIKTDLGVMEQEARTLNRGFVSRMTRGRPWVTLKLAMSLDGRTAMASGESRWITGAEARADVHRLRAAAGAVLTSVNTVLADDPKLTVRLPLKTLRQPDRIVLDAHLRTPVSAKIWNISKGAGGARRIVLTVRPPATRIEALRKKSVEVIQMGKPKDKQVDLASALATLGRMEINEVLVESGPRLAGALLQAGLVDELVIYAAPSLLGSEARALAHLPGLASLKQRLKFRFADARGVGTDLRITAVPERR